MKVMQNDTYYFFKGHITLDPEQGGKLTVNQPHGVAAGARIMAVEFCIPRSLFDTPQLQAKITISEEQSAHIKVDADAVATSLSEVVGARVEVTITKPEDQTNG